MSFLASDLMRGRDTGSPEIRLAAEYLASRLRALGAEPMGDTVDGRRTYFQSYPLRRTSLATEDTKLEIEPGGEGDEIEAQINRDYVAWPVQNVQSGSFSGPLVFAGFGLVDEASKYDDYAGLDVTGKFVLALDGAPGGDVKIERTDVEFKRDLAQKKGAVGLLLVHPPGVSVAPYKQTLAFARIRSQRPQLIFTGSEFEEAAGDWIPTLYLEDELRDKLLGTGEAAANRKPGDLEGSKVSFDFPYKDEKIFDRNVVAVFRGSDPALSKQLVVFSAHYDHVGTTRGEIYNGSDDNASGTSALLEIAEAFSESPRPARSVVFLWVSGEEHGLWGSKYFSDHQTVAEDEAIVADINLDMVSRNDTHEVGVTPSPSHADYSTLIPQAEEACKAEDLKMLFNSDEFYARTDSYNFAAKGIPIIFFFSGVHEDYHRPTDDFEKADFDKAARIARAAFRLGWQVAQEPEKPHKIEAPAK